MRRKYIKRSRLLLQLVLQSTIVLILSFYVTYCQYKSNISINKTIVAYLKVEESDISTRLEEIVESLSEYADELTEIQEELETKITYVENLKKEAEAAESVLDLSEEQLTTINSMFRNELAANEERSFWPNLFNNLFFCIFGMIAPPLFKTLWNYIHRFMYLRSVRKKNH